jgi:lipopolysaccharide transport system ATP-binding protein
MSDTVIQIDRVSKHYRLGSIGAKTLSGDLSRRWAKLRGKPDPSTKIGQPATGNGSGAEANVSDELWALRDVSFEVKQGEVMGIIGRNGAGKSTLLKILSRVTGPTSGEVRVKGRIASLLEVGTGFHPELTGRENVFLNGAILGMRNAEIRAKFDEIVDFSGVEQFIDTPVKRYSSGMTVRLAFAVAAYLDPEILIIDEVLAVGDAEFQKKCLGKMSAVAKGGRTVLFVSHNMAAVQNLCTGAIVLLSGEVKFHGEARDAIGFYINETDQSAETKESEDLTGRKRPTWASPYIVEAHTLDANGIPCSSFDLASDLVVKMTVRCPVSAMIRQPVMGVVINHAVFGPVAGVNMRMTGSDYRKGRFENFSMVCRIGSMPFLQGNYTIDLWLGDGPRDVDAVSGCLRIQVVGTDIYGSGKLPNANLGVTFLNADWEVNNNSNVETRALTA